MSYDLAVWEGGRPVSDGSAAEIYRACTQLLDEEVTVTPRIRAYAEALLARWPDGDDETLGR